MPIQTIVILDHHQSNDQRISRHMQFCIKSGYDITRINFTIQENKKKGETISSSNTKQIPIFLPLKQGIARYIWYNVSFFYPYYIIKTINILKSKFKKSPEPIILHIHDPIFLLYGIIMKIIFPNKIILIYDRHEYYEKMRGIGSLCERISQIFINGIILINNGQISGMKKFFPSVMFFTIVPNYPLIVKNESINIIQKIEQLCKTGQINMTYIGSLSTKVDRDIYGLLEISSVLLEKYPNIHFTIGGSTNDRELLTAFLKMEQNFPDRFNYCGFLEREEVIRITREAHLGFFLLHPHTNYWVPCSPNKLFDYLAYGVIPIIRAPIENMEELKTCSEIYNYKISNREIALDIEKLINNIPLICTMIQKVYDASELYTFESVETQYSTLYKETIENYLSTVN
nr:hypothetical protein [uncultured Methanospirillum sp.]